MRPTIKLRCSFRNCPHTVSDFILPYLEIYNFKFVNFELARFNMACIMSTAEKPPAIALADIEKARLDRILVWRLFISETVANVLILIVHFSRPQENKKRMAEMGLSQAREKLDEANR